MSDLYAEVRKCLACDSTQLQPILSLGEHILTNFEAPTDAHQEPLRAPLVLLSCGACGLVQLKNQVDPELLYGMADSSYYWYRSSMNRSMRDHLGALMAQVAREVLLEPGDILVDIGCNDGYMLSSLWAPGVIRVGFEPGKGLAEEARRQGLYVFNSLFTEVPYSATFHRRARAVTAVAMFYDVPDPQRFLWEVREILGFKGVLVLEMNTLLDMVKNTAYDMIGHEHLAYWSLQALQPLLARVGLKAFRVDHSMINGGTTRFWICRAGDQRKLEDSVARQMEEEERDLTAQKVREFGARAAIQARQLHEWVEKEVANEGRVYVWGASTRGRTIMQASDIDDLIAGASEIHPEKIGRVIGGTKIPIVHEDEARKDATAFIVLPYSYRKDVLEKERDWVAKGGKLVFPLPQLEVIGPDTPFNWAMR